MASFGVCADTSEAVPLHASQGLYLKPIARINISVQLPQLKTAGSSISNWEVMEKLKKMIKPDNFLALKVVKSALEFVRFEGEVENKSKLVVHIGNLDGKGIKLSGFSDVLKVRAAEAKLPFPSRHDWDSFFRDAKNMNEMRPGERPDTVHLRGLPCRWFSTKSDRERNIPSESVVRRVFESFGEILCLDIPMLDPYRTEMGSSKGSIQTFSFGQDFLFEVFVQYTEYMGFVKAMNALRGMKLMYHDNTGGSGEDKAMAVNIKVDFDKTKHLSEKSIRLRRLEREKMMQLEKDREDRVKKEREEKDRKIEEEKRRIEAEEMDRDRKRDEKLRIREERRLDREDKRREQKREKRRADEEKEMQMRIAVEERKILIAHRKLETIRLLSELFNSIKVVKQQEDVVRREKELEQERLRLVEREHRKKLAEEKRRILQERKKSEQLQLLEQELRKKIMRNIRLVEENRADQLREEARKKFGGTAAKLKSAVVRKT